MNTGGFADIRSYKPNTPSEYSYLFSTIYNYSSISTKDSFTVTGTGDYIIGTVGATISSVQVAYIYVKKVTSSTIRF